MPGGADTSVSEAAGLSPERLLADGLGPVNLETTLRFHAELRADDEATCPARSPGDRVRLIAAVIYETVSADTGSFV